MEDIIVYKTKTYFRQLKKERGSGIVSIQCLVLRYTCMTTKRSEAFHSQFKLQLLSFSTSLREM